ncbi:MAG: hypothetical protein ACKVH8_18005 [Pirellulales bacterium]
MNRLIFIYCSLFAALITSPLLAEIQPETVLENLSNPAGVAVQPNTGHVFVSDSAAGRVIRVVDGKLEEVITGFPKDVYGKGPKYDIGPLGLTFIDEETLVVGGGGLPDGEELLRVYTIPAAGQPAMDAAKLTAELAPLSADDKIKGEGNFYGVAVTSKGIFVTCNGDDEQGWIAKATISFSQPSQDEKQPTNDETTSKRQFSDFERFISTKSSVEKDAPAAITISPRGELVIGQMGEITEAGDSQLTFYDPVSQKMLLNLPTDVSDIVGLAYSPDSERLYAVDFSWHDTQQGALYRLDATRRSGRQAVNPTKMLDLDKPTALAFAPDGTLYITVFGTAEEGSDKPAGKLLKIPSGL